MSTFVVLMLRWSILDPTKKNGNDCRRHRVLVVGFAGGNAVASASGLTMHRANRQGRANSSRGGSSYIVGAYGSSGDLRTMVRLFVDGTKGSNSVSGSTASIYGGSGVRFTVRPIVDRLSGSSYIVGTFIVAT